MNCLARLFSFCCSKRDSHKEVEQEEVELQTLAPSSEQTSSTLPTPTTPAPQRPHYRYATLTPRMLAPFPPTADFAHGGDVRKPLHTFSAIWSDVSESASDSQDIVYNFIYEGECGITWPLRRIRVDNREIELQEDEAGLAEEEEVYDTEYEADIEEDGAAPSFSQASLPQSQEAPRKLRIRIRRSTHLSETETPRVLPRRFRVRVRTSNDLDAESMRPLPRRRGALVLQPVIDGEEGQEGRGVYGILRPKAATAPCGMASEIRKDSAVEGR
jgi:hypothetical protein